MRKLYAEGPRHPCHAFTSARTTKQMSYCFLSCAEHLQDSASFLKIRHPDNDISASMIYGL